MQRDLEALVAGTLAGDENAWQRLWQAVEPGLYALLRRPHVLGRLSQSEDDCRSIVVEVMGRLRANRFARLAQYVEARQKNPTVPFMGWLLVVAKRTAIDYMRGLDTYIDRRHIKDSSSPGAWRDLQGLPSDSQLPGERPPVTGRGTANQLIAFAQMDLAPEEVSALSAWLEGATFEEIAASSDGDARRAERSVRASLARLRRRFRPENE